MGTMGAEEDPFRDHPRSDYKFQSGTAKTTGCGKPERVEELIGEERIS
jgi:hypothetical protein